MSKTDPFKSFHSRAETLRVPVMLCIRFPLSPLNVDDMLHERRVAISREAIRFWWQGFGPLVASEIGSVGSKA